MIAKLTGRIEALEADRCVIDVGGVGYLVQASTRTLAALPTGADRELLIETQVREDAISLFGFADPAERDWFRLLTTVQGVGARVALSVLSALSPRELIMAIQAGDRAALTRAPGVGAQAGGAAADRIAREGGGDAGGDGLRARAAPRRRRRRRTRSRRWSISAIAARRRRRRWGGWSARLGAGTALDALIRESLKELAHSV